MPKANSAVGRGKLLTETNGQKEIEIALKVGKVDPQYLTPMLFSGEWCLYDVGRNIIYVSIRTAYVGASKKFDVEGKHFVGLNDRLLSFAEEKHGLIAVIFAGVTTHAFGYYANFVLDWSNKHKAFANVGKYRQIRLRVIPIDLESCTVLVKGDLTKVLRRLQQLKRKKVARRGEQGEII